MEAANQAALLCPSKQKQTRLIFLSYPTQPGPPLPRPATQPGEYSRSQGQILCHYPGEKSLKTCLSCLLTESDQRQQQWQRHRRHRRRPAAAHSRFSGTGRVLSGPPASRSSVFFVVGTSELQASSTGGSGIERGGRGGGGGQ